MFMYCKICGDKDISINLLGTNVCKNCISEMTEISILDERYDLYKNCIRIFFGYYIEAMVPQTR